MSQEYNPDSIVTREILQINAFDPNHKIILYTDDDHSHIREHFVWEQIYDKKGKLLPEVKFILLKDITLAHLKSLCYLSVNWKDEKLSKLFVDEWDYRIERGITMSNKEKFIIDNRDMLKEIMKSVKACMVISTGNISMEDVDVILDQVDDHLDSFVDDYVGMLQEGEE